MLSYINKTLFGDSWEILPDIPDDLCRLAYLDPPYNLAPRSGKSQVVPETIHNSYFESVCEDWDKEIITLEEIVEMLIQLKRILTPDGTIVISGTYHNIFLWGYAMKYILKFYIINTVIWSKPDAMFNHFALNKMVADHEIMIWARPSADVSHYFNYEKSKELFGVLVASSDEEKFMQMRSTWTEKEIEETGCRYKWMLKKIIEAFNAVVGAKAMWRESKGKGKAPNYWHPTQKPEWLIERWILMCSEIGDVVIDPFCGSNTTGYMADKHNRKFISIEKTPEIFEVAKKRVMQPIQTTMNI